MKTLANKPNPVPLPPNPYSPGSPSYDAYDHCLTLEQLPGWQTFHSDLARDSSERIMLELPPIIVARVLGYALRLAPSEEGRDALTREIISCAANPELLAGLGHLYVFGLTRVFYNPKGPTPCISASQSPRRSFEEQVDAGSHLLEPSLVTNPELRRLTLIRDQNSCIFTGWLESNLEEAALIAAYQLNPRQLIRTQVAHIISQSLSSNVEGMTQEAREKFAWASSSAAIIERFGGFSAQALLGDANLNSPLNAFTASQTPHSWFDQLDLWLEPVMMNGVLIPNTYHLRHPDAFRFKYANLKSQIIFRTALDPTGAIIPPPHPRLLALHAACAQVAHLSGAAGYISELYGDPDQEGISVMTDPRATTELVRKLNVHVISSTA